MKQAVTKHDFRNEYNANVFLVGALPTNATAATATHFAIYVKAVRGNDKGKFVELTSDIKGQALNDLVNKKGTDAAADTKAFALTDVKIVDEVALTKTYVSADGKEVVKQGATGAKLASVNDDAITSMAALYDIDA